MEEIQQQQDLANGTEKKKEKSALREIVESILIAIVLAFMIRYFLFQPFYIPSGSMEPTLKPYDRIIVSKMSFWFSEPERGDVIVFRYPLDPSRDFVKRVIALEGETVEIRNNQLLINNEVIDEPYLPPLVMRDYGPTKVSEGHLFVLGDNRNHSDDSRFWGFVPEEYLVGKSVLIYWPPDRIELLGGK
ncbi:signal peptidase I [Heliorestis acidaminivorans]|uniref:Signal peptidase I n=1 Tax=Heliorestis acidaminivorans TaxID=553427 RepID=A0A6I0F0F2_9FIRM|nr:signal peptidase I [Heliorestis acidaminivorans]KAB2954426.1 signal peptidase I [Heliorestis acidaminivorans]